MAHLPVLLACCPVYVFFLTFSPIFTEYIDIFRIGIFLRAKGIPCPPPLACRSTIPTATASISLCKLHLAMALIGIMKWHSVYGTLGFLVRGIS